MDKEVIFLYFVDSSQKMSKFKFKFNSDHKYTLYPFANGTSFEIMMI